MTNEQLEKGSQVKRSVSARTPKVDVFENDTELLLLADFPGVEVDGVQVSVEASELRIEGRVNDAQRFFRTFRLAESVDSTSVEAALERGVLKVQLKKNTARGPRRIPVKAS